MLGRARYLILAGLLQLACADATPEALATAKSLGPSVIAERRPANITRWPPLLDNPSETPKTPGSAKNVGTLPVSPLPPLGYYRYWRYRNEPSYKKAHFAHYISNYPYRDQPAIPACAANTTKNYCLVDNDYPYEYIRNSLTYHYYAVLSLYSNIILSTSRSVDRKYLLRDETYLCPSETKYVQPLRAKNTNGKWRMIVNKVFGNNRSFKQHARIEECLSSGESCPLVPHCYETKCVQKSVVQHFLVYDPADKFLPFAVEAFSLPGSCACHIGAF